MLLLLCHPSVDLIQTFFSTFQKATLSARFLSQNGGAISNLSPEDKESRLPGSSPKSHRPSGKWRKGKTAKKLARQLGLRNHVAKDRAAKAWPPHS
jgi:hypothetical protein